MSFDTSRVANKWQGYLPSNYRSYWSHVWNSTQSGKEVAFIWSIWQKVVIVNEWRACITHVSISKQFIFYLPNTSELIKHNIWECIQARKEMVVDDFHHAQTLWG
jgi:hypothetical protein